MQITDGLLVVLVRSRSLLIFEEHHGWEELHSSAVTVDSHDAWDRGAEIISQHHKAAIEEISRSQEKSYTLSNDSRDGIVRHR